MSKNQFQYQDLFQKDIIAVYKQTKRDHLMRYGRISRIALLTAVVNSPAKRFYTSEEQASRVIRGMLKGQLYPKMKPLTREMYLEIFSRVLKLQKRFPDECIQHLVERVINEPAPKFYLTPRALEQKLCDMKTGRRGFCSNNPFVNRNNITKK